MLLIGTEDDPRADPDDLAAAHAEYDGFWRRLAPSARRLPLALPVFRDQRVAGLVLGTRDADAFCVFIRPAFRGRGTGDAVVAWLTERGDDLIASDATRGYFEERGYHVSGRTEDGLIRLAAPSRAATVRAAGSICLLQPEDERVLIGRRLTSSWHGYWAFPGGKLDPGETPLQGALRELYEETGVAVSSPAVALETRVYARNADTLFAIDNFCIPVSTCSEPIPSAELEARWMSLDHALELRPMAAGTRRVVRRIAAALRNGGVSSYSPDVRPGPLESRPRTR